MSNANFSPDWIKQLSMDPYAVLGVAVTADDRRILKRYRQAAKQLHPDVMINESESDREFAGQVLSRLINPAYQRLKQDKDRAETLATLRLKVRRLTREEKLEPQGEQAKKLMAVPEEEVEVFYEQILVEMAEGQYVTVTTFTEATQAIAELNLIYLRRKMGNLVIREKRAGLVAAAAVQSPNAPVAAPTPEAAPINYAQRHVTRAKTYIRSQKYSEAIKELKDAVRIEPNNSDYHAMLGQAYMMSKMTGMAKVHIRQALKLNPHHQVALKYAAQLDIDTSSLNGTSGGTAAKKKGGVFGLFAKKT